RALTIDPASRTAVVGPGLLNAEVKAAAAEKGLWYPPDPSSFEICSIGGNLATNAGGLSCVKYGVTSDYVLALEVVLADGEAVRVGGPWIKDVAGLPLTKLFVGSEGTLGIITEATLRLTPRPAPSTVGVAYFRTVQDAANAVVEATNRFRPSICEFIDHVSLTTIEAHARMGLDTDAAAMLIVGTDETGEAAAAELAIIEEVFEHAGATESFLAEDTEQSDQFLAARRMAAPSYEVIGATLIEDVGVPIPKLAELLIRIEQVAERHGVTIATVAHAGDGNTHPTVIYTPGDPDSLARAQAAFADIMNLAVELGGTITGEHGVGAIKHAYLPRQLGEGASALTARIKAALDPQGIFNPGIGI
ncbi:MAG: FAD-linked oxidase C-terminal domain-containing protein, partial [Microbacterium sp.]